jgi:hypothetical protein
MRQIAAVCIALAGLTLALGYLGGGLWIGAAASLALCGLWLLGLWRGWHRLDPAGLAGLIGLAGIGVWFTRPPGLMLLGVVAALAGWDLARFAQRLRAVGQIEGVEALGRAHLRRLALAGAAGLLLGVLALVIRVSLSFGAALLLAALALLGLSRVIGYLNRAGDDLG